MIRQPCARYEKGSRMRTPLYRGSDEGRSCLSATGAADMVQNSELVLNSTQEVREGTSNPLLDIGIGGTGTSSPCAPLVAPA